MFNNSDINCCVKPLFILHWRSLLGNIYYPPKK
nr:MAG TPA: hypothetical protein [Bacteriophage sp.]